MKYYKAEDGTLFPTINIATEYIIKDYIQGCVYYSMPLEQIKDSLKLEEVEVEINPTKQFVWNDAMEISPQPPHSHPNFKRNFYLVRLKNGQFSVLAYEFPHYDNDIYPVGWHPTDFPVTHWMEIPGF